ncbi:ABC transporter ATP-binding protein [Acetobacter sp. TBRC 12305]|uniref:ABC transporter ATP-binding protein n=1 Tax=Acetobacter garciniae TaxID=2817435 RepID=A0A939HJP8_9PROT|nr:ABC transporter ATP-binding protein [Acetobacter garciniae]MBO1325693.1 ABC transporter ATP-binding protein [Acetobacter garciniae]MBX0345593.1 ABC transporter ATP-binding protein [Acetobacter garciniae]
MSAILHACGLKVRFGGLEAIGGVDLCVRAGAIHGLIGPNGAGKTTLLNALSGFVRLAAGQLRFNGHEIAGRRPDAIAALGLSRTFQNIRLFGAMTVLESLLVGAHRQFDMGAGAIVLGSARSKVAERAMIGRAHMLLDFVGLGADTAARVATTLSYGQQRRVEIARALMSSPQLVLLDEPLAGMNALEKQEIATLVRSVRAQGTTLLLIEHDMQIVRDLCDHLTVLDHGKRLADGPPRDVLADPAVQAAYLGRGR